MENVIPVAGCDYHLRFLRLHKFTSEFNSQRALIESRPRTPLIWASFGVSSNQHLIHHSSSLFIHAKSTRINRILRRATNVIYSVVPPATTYIHHTTQRRGGRRKSLRNRWHSGLRFPVTLWVPNGTETTTQVRSEANTFETLSARKKMTDLQR